MISRIKLVRPCGLEAIFLKLVLPSPAPSFIPNKIFALLERALAATAARLAVAEPGGTKLPAALT